MVISSSEIQDFMVFAWDYQFPILLSNPNSLLVVDGPFSTDSPNLERLKETIAVYASFDTGRIVTCDSARALRGSSVLVKDPSSPSAVRRFQEDVSASNIPRIIERLSSSISLGPDSLRTSAAQALAKSAVILGGGAMERAKEEVDRLRRNAGEVMERILEEREKAIAAILGSDPDLTSREEKGRIVLGMERVAKEVEPVLDDLSWTKLPFVVDDVSTRVDGAVERALARQFGNEVSYSLSYVRVEITNICLVAHVPNRSSLSPSSRVEGRPRAHIQLCDSLPIAGG